jgi:hypothetical protein
MAPSPKKAMAANGGSHATQIHSFQSKAPRQGENARLPIRPVGRWAENVWRKMSAAITRRLTPWRVVNLAGYATRRAGGGKDRLG